MAANIPVGEIRVYRDADGFWCVYHSGVNEYIYTTVPTRRINTAVNKMLTRNTRRNTTEVTNKSNINRWIKNSGAQCINVNQAMFRRPTGSRRRPLNNNTAANVLLNLSRLR